MSHFATGLSAGIIATVIVSNTAFVPTPAEAARLSKADKFALKQATVACKAEARGKKIGMNAGQDEAEQWLASRKFVKNCILEALKDHPNIKIIQMHLDKDMKSLSAQKINDRSFVFTRE
jgi:hypothetical protein